MFLKEVSYIHQLRLHLFNQNTVKVVILLQFKIPIYSIIWIYFTNVFLWCKAAFLTSILQSSVSHDPSEIILIC